MEGLVTGLRTLGPVRLLALAGVGAAVLGLLAFLVMRASVPPMAPLFGELETRDAAAVVAALERARIPHRLAAGGTQVLAPIEDIPRLRLMLAREGLPSGGGVGWEIFDRTDSLTTTPFQQDVNRLRALEGELSRTIRGLAGVRAARVHLVLPRREAFSRERGEAQASVVLTMQGAQRLDREGVQAVLHLIATAVPGLRPQNIAIVDSRGELLARSGQALSGPAAAQTQEELRRAQELRIARAVEELLERTLGPGRVRAEATVDLDFERVELREERFDPDNQVPRSQQSVTESSREGEPQPVTVANNLPGTNEGGGQGGPTSQENRQEETTNFEIGRTIRSTLREHPSVRRISLAVLVDGVVEPPAEPGGAPQLRERTPEELQRIATLVRAAAGLDERRGDQVQVVSMRFAAPEEPLPEPAGFLGLPFSPPVMARLVETALIALVALAALLFVGRPMVGRLTATLAPPTPALAGAAAGAVGGPAGAIAGAAGALPGAEGGTAGALPGAAGSAVGALPGAAGGEGGEDDMVSLAHVSGQLRASSLIRLTKLVEQHPDETLAVLRRWLEPQDD